MIIELQIDNIVACMVRRFLGIDPDPDVIYAYKRTDTLSLRVPMDFAESCTVLALFIRVAMMTSNIRIVKSNTSCCEKYQGQETCITYFGQAVMLLASRKQPTRGFTVRIIGDTIAAGHHGAIRATPNIKLAITTGGSLHYELEKHPKVFKYRDEQCHAKYHKYLDMMQKEVDIFEQMHGGTRPVIANRTEIYYMMLKIPGRDLGKMIRFRELSKLSEKDKIMIAYTKCKSFHGKCIHDLKHKDFTSSGLQLKAFHP